MLDSPRTVSSIERLLYLKRVPAFGTLPASELAVFAEAAQERFFPKGSVLLRAGEPIGAVYLIVEGSVRVERRGRLLGTVGPGVALGGLGLFARDPEGIEATAEADTLALELEADTVLEILEDRFPILLHTMRDVCRQFIDALIKARIDPGAGFPAFDEPLLPSRELDLVERIFYMRRMPAFQESSVDALFELSRTLTEVRFGPGVTLWEAGDASGAAGAMFLIVRGRVSCTIAATQVLFRAGPGFPLGTLDAVAEGPRWYTAVTETSVVALNGSAEALVDVFEDNFEMAMDFLAAVSQGMVRLVQARFAEDASASPLI